MIDAHTPLARKDSEQPDQRQREQHACRGARAREGDGEPDRSQAGVDHVDRAHRPELEPRRHAERGPLADRRAAVVERKLGRECGDIERPLPKIGLPTRRPEPRTRAGPTAYQESLSRTKTRPIWIVPRAYSSPLPSRMPAATASGTIPSGKHEQHRDENELRRDRRAAPHLEIEPERDCVGGEQKRDRDHGGRSVGGQQQSHASRQPRGRARGRRPSSRDRGSPGG